MDEITDKYLDKLYNDLHCEQMRLMNIFKTGCDAERDKDIQQQITLINTIMITAIRLRNKRKKVVKKS